MIKLNKMFGGKKRDMAAAREEVLSNLSQGCTGVAAEISEISGLNAEFYDLITFDDFEKELMHCKDNPKRREELLVSLKAIEQNLVKKYSLGRTCYQSHSLTVGHENV